MRLGECVLFSMPAEDPDTDSEYKSVWRKRLSEACKTTLDVELDYDIDLPAWTGKNSELAASQAQFLQILIR